MTSSSPQSTARQTLRGTVRSRSGDKTVAVTVKRVVRHPLYRKSITHTKHYLAHDPNNTAEVGQEVTIVATRPISRRKRWLVVQTKAAAQKL